MKNIKMKMIFGYGNDINSRLEKFIESVEIKDCFDLIDVKYSTLEDNDGDILHNVLIIYSIS